MRPDMRCPKCERTFESPGRFCTQCASALQHIEFTCNMCGLSCTLGCKDSPAAGPHGLIKQTVSGGYESTPGNGHGALDDGTSYTFSLCEFCLDWLFSKFKVPVSVSYYMGGGEPPEVWKPAAEKVADDDWRKMKKEFTEEHDKRAAARNK